MKDELLPSLCVLKMWFQVYACLVLGLVFWIFWSHPEGWSIIDIGITLRLVTELGDSMWPYLPILLLTLCFLSFFLLFVCLSLSLSPVAAILLHGCPDCGLRSGGRLLLWDTTWRQVAVLFPFSQVPLLASSLLLSPFPAPYFWSVIYFEQSSSPGVLSTSPASQSQSFFHMLSSFWRQKEKAL